MWCDMEEWTWWIWVSQPIAACNHNLLTKFYTSGYYAPLVFMPKASKTPASHQPTLKASAQVKASMARQVKEVPSSSNPQIPIQLILKYLHISTVQLLMVIEVEHSVTHHPSTITHQPIQHHCLLHPILLAQKLVLVIKISTLGSYTIHMQSKDVPRRWSDFARHYNTLPVVQHLSPTNLAQQLQSYPHQPILLWLCNFARHYNTWSVVQHCHLSLCQECGCPRPPR